MRGAYRLQHLAPKKPLEKLARAVSGKGRWVEIRLEGFQATAWRKKWEFEEFVFICRNKRKCRYCVIGRGRWVP